MFSNPISPIVNSKAKTFIFNLLAGGISAGISKTLTCPIEIIKTRLQSNDEMIKQGLIDKPYKGILDCLNRTIKDEGVHSLWKGNLSSVLAYFPTQSMNFAIKSYYKQLFPYDKNLNQSLLFYNVRSGAIAGIMSMICFHPLDYMKTKFSTDVKTKKKRYKNTFDVLRKSSSLFKIYDGLLPSCLCMAIYRGLYFGLYDSLNKRVNNPVGKLFLGWGVTIASSGFAFPFDTLRKRIIVASDTDKEYKNSYDCLKYMIGHDGWESLFKGYNANIIRSLSGALVLFFYGGLKNKITEYISAGDNDKNKKRKNNKKDSLGVVIKETDFKDSKYCHKK